MAKKAQLSFRTRERARKGQIAGLLPPDYWSNPKKHKDEIGTQAKAKVRRLMWGLFEKRHGKDASSLKSMFKRTMVDRVGFE